MVDMLYGFLLQFFLSLVLPLVAYAGGDIVSGNTVDSLVCGNNLVVYVDGSDSYKGAKPVDIINKSVSVRYGKSGDLNLSGTHDDSMDYDVVISGREFVSNISLLNLYGSCALKGKDMRSEELTLNSNTYGNVQITGALMVKKITQSKSNVIDIYWLDGGLVYIDSMAGKMRLAGAVDSLRVSAGGYAFLMLENLMADDIWLKAGDSSFVRLDPLDSKEFVYLTGNAKVENYGFPEFISDVSDHSAIVVNNLGKKAKYEYLDKLFPSFKNK